MNESATAHRALRISLVALCTSLAATPALAQTSAENVAAARSLGVEGIRLADSGNCAAAVEKLERAEALYHAPTTLTRLGECQIALGRIVVGTENLNRVIREALPANAPRAFVDAQQRARKVFDAAMPKIAQLTVVVEPPNAQPSVTIDGQPLPGVLLGASRPTDPGTHEVRATAPGYLAATQSVTLAEGGTGEVKLVLEPDPNAAAATPPPAAPTLPPASDPNAPGSGMPGATSGSGQVGGDTSTGAERDNTAAYVLLGVGGAGLVVGGVFGLMALSKKSDLECGPNNQCAGDQADNLSTAKSFALISTIGFGIGVAGAAVGTVLLVSGGSSSASAPSKRLAQSSSFRATPWVGLGSAGVTGTF